MCVWKENLNPSEKKKQKTVRVASYFTEKIDTSKECSDQFSPNSVENRGT